MPKGHGNRITKPPSAKQRANVVKNSQVLPRLPDPDLGKPDRSWWLGLERDAFDAVAAAQVARMKLVK
jgi:hypothetical protein